MIVYVLIMEISFAFFLFCISISIFFLFRSGVAKLMQMPLGMFGSQFGTQCGTIMTVGMARYGGQGVRVDSWPYGA